MIFFLWYKSLWTPCESSLKAGLDFGCGLNGSGLEFPGIWLRLFHVSLGAEPFLASPKTNSGKKVSLLQHVFSNLFNFAFTWKMAETRRYFWLLWSLVGFFCDMSRQCTSPKKQGQFIHSLFMEVNEVCSHSCPWGRLTEVWLWQPSTNYNQKYPISRLHLKGPDILMWAVISVFYILKMSFA